MVSSMYLFSTLSISLIALIINLASCAPINSLVSDAIENNMNAENLKSDDHHQINSLNQQKLSITKREYPMEGILLGKREYPTEGILLGKRDYPTEGILLGKRDYPTEGILLGKRGHPVYDDEYPTEGILIGRRNLRF